LNVELLVRHATNEDIEAIVRIERAANEAPHWEQAQYPAILQQEGRRVLLVAVAEGQVVGFVVAAVLLEEAELENIAVDAAFRRCGVGKALLDAVMVWAVEHGSELMRLEVRAGNKAAQGLYRGLGFVQNGVRQGYYTEPIEDAAVMSLSLSAQPD